MALKSPYNFGFYRSVCIVFLLPKKEEHEKKGIHLSQTVFFASFLGYKPLVDPSIKKVDRYIDPPFLSHMLFSGWVGVAIWKNAQVIARIIEDEAICNDMFEQNTSAQVELKV